MSAHDSRIHSLFYNMVRRFSSLMFDIVLHCENFSACHTSHLQATNFDFNEFVVWVGLC